LDTGKAQYIYKEGIRWQRKIKVVAVRVVNKLAVRRAVRAAAVSKVAAAANKVAAAARVVAVAKVVARAAVAARAAAAAETDNHN
jgi:hypothetical protein